MSLVKWSPLKELYDMRRDMDRMFNEVFAPGARPSRSDTGSGGISVEMFDRKQEVVVRAEIPGVHKEDIELSITKETLTLKGERRREEEIREEGYYFCERSYGTFVRTIALPAEVDSEKAKASVKDGVIEIVLPKKEEAKAKEIKIEVS